MPLYIVDRDDHRQISADDLAQIMNIDKAILGKIQTNPVFVINPALTRPDKLNGGIIAPAGKRSKPKIYIRVTPPTAKAKYGVITDDMSATQIEVRYATTIVPDKINPRISTYEPKRLVFDDQMDIVPNVEEALFKYCLPSCKDSPIADKRNWYYSFQNKQKAAAEITDKGLQIAKALSYITNDTSNGGLSERQLLLIAKGIYAQNRNPSLIPNPSARNKTTEEVKADLITFALKDPATFMSTVDDDVNEFYGMILDAVDRGIVGIRTGANKKGWYWETGPEAGRHITDISTGTNDFDALKAAIESNPNAFYSTITRAVTTAAGKENINNFIKTQKAAAVEAATSGGDDLIDNGGGLTDNGGAKQPGADFVFELPANYQDSNKMAALFNNGKLPIAKVLGKFWEAIKEKRVTAENAKEILTNLVETITD